MWETVRAAKMSSREDLSTMWWNGTTAAAASANAALIPLRTKIFSKSFQMGKKVLKRLGNCLRESLGELKRVISTFFLLIWQMEINVDFALWVGAKWVTNQITGPDVSIQKVFYGLPSFGSSNEVNKSNLKRPPPLRD